MIESNVIRALAIAFICAGIVGCGSPHSRFESHLARAQRYIAEHNLDKAGVELRNALQIEPKSAEALNLLGQVAEQRGAIRDAVKYYRASIDTNPDYELARANLARAYVFGGGAKPALEVISPGLAKHPDDAELLAVRAAARHQLKDDPGAMEDLQRALRADPGNEDAVGILAGLYEGAGESERAIAAAQTALERKPASVGLHVVLARLYANANEPAAAEQELQRLVRLQPDLVAPRVDLARFLVGEKKLDSAEEVLRDGVKALPSSDEAKLSLVDFIAQVRSRSEGEKALRDLIAQDPKDYGLQLALGALLQRSGAEDDAITVYRAVAAHAGDDDPKALTARDRIAQIDARSARYDDALRELAVVLKQNPADDAALQLRGGIELERQDVPGAITDLRTVLHDNPSDLNVQRTLAQAYVAQGDTTLAEQTLRAAMDQSPTDVPTRLQLAEVLGNSGRGAEAVELVKETANRSPSDPRPREALVRADLAQRDFTSAQEALDALRVMEPRAPVIPYLEGLIAEAQGRLDASQKAFEAALQARPGAVDALASLSKVMLIRAQGAEAIAEIQRAVQKDPHNPLLRNLLAETLIATKRYPEALLELSQAVEAAPRWPLLYHNIAGLKALSGDLPGAVAACEKGLDVIPYEPTLTIDLASLYERAGQPEKAISEYEKMYARSQRLDTVANNLALLLVTYRSDRASLDRARDLAAKFANSDDSNLLDTYGWVHLKRGETQIALPVLERALKGAPNSREIRYHLAMAELQSGQQQRAKSDLEAALSGSAHFAGSNDAKAVLASLNSSAG